MTVETSCPVRVLLVDDDEDEFVLTRHRLSEVDAGGFELSWAPDYDAARSAMQQRVHDVYLVDYRLGERSGLELLREVQETVRRSPVIVLTGVGNRDVDLEAMRLGATSYLTKADINSRVLERTIRYTLEIHRARADQRRVADRLRHHGAQQAVLAELGRRLLTAADEPTAATMAVNALVESGYGAAGAFFPGVDDALELRAGQAWPSEITARHVLAVDGFGPDFRASSAPAILDGTSPLAARLHALGFGHGVAVGVPGPARTLGILVALGMRDQPPADDDVAFVETTSQVLAQAIERQQAVREQGRLQERLRRSEMMSTLGKLVAGVAHETRNPLFGILATLDALEARFGKQTEMSRYVGVLRAEVQRLNALMGDLLEYGRPHAVQLIEGSIGELVDDAVNACAIAAAEASVHVRTRIATDVPPLTMDARGLGQVVQNLLLNAIQHSPASGVVTIRALVVEGKRGPCVVCRVEDEGTGIAAEDLPRVFEPFFSRREGGTGLGLAIVQRVVEQHGGTIRAANREPHGAAITFELPLTPPTV